MKLVHYYFSAMQDNIRLREGTGLLGPPLVKSLAVFVHMCSALNNSSLLSVALK